MARGGAGRAGLLCRLALAVGAHASVKSYWPTVSDALQGSVAHQKKKGGSLLPPPRRRALLVCNLAAQ